MVVCKTISNQLLFLLSPKTTTYPLGTTALIEGQLLINFNTLAYILLFGMGKMIMVGMYLQVFIYVISNQNKTYFELLDLNHVCGS